MAKRTRLSGFTLVELLTVMTIIGLLASILFPSIYAARQAVWRSQCHYNLENLAKAMTAYAAANKQWYPAHSGSSPMKVGSIWKEWFRKDGIHPEIVYCPSKCIGRSREMADEAWKQDGPDTQYEILAGWTTLGTKWLRTDLVASKDMIAGDYLAKVSDDKWDGNHLQGGSNSPPAGRNALFGGYDVQWVPFDKTDDKDDSGASRTPYYTGGEKTYYMPDGIKD